MTFKPGCSGNPAGSRPKPKITATDLASLDLCVQEYQFIEIDNDIYGLDQPRQLANWWLVSQENGTQESKE